MEKHNILGENSTEEKMFKAAEMRRRGATLQEIADVLDCSTNYVSVLLKMFINPTERKRERTKGVIPAVDDYLSKEKISVAEFARKIGLSKGNLYSKLKGTFDFTLKDIILLHNATGISYNDLISDELCGNILKHTKKRKKAKNKETD